MPTSLLLLRRTSGRAHLRSLPLAFAVAPLLAGIMATSAGATIIVGRSIAGVALGASEAQVTQTLGAPTLRQPPDVEGNIEWNYAKPPLLGALGLRNGSVIGLWTSSRRQKTAKGVGPGSSLAQVRHAYPKATCSTGPFGPKAVACTLYSTDGGRGVETIFMFFTRSMPAREVDLDFT
jgi:hypothetical protein